jgi:hypothetical protein
MPNPALCEHLQYGLPGHDGIIEMINNEKMAYHYFSYGNLYRWIEMMILKHFLMSREDSEKLHESCDRFYNLTYSGIDTEPPCYRTFYVLAHKSCTRYLKELQKMYPAVAKSSPTAPHNVLAFLKDVLIQPNISHMQYLENSLKEKESTILELQKLISMKDQHIKNLELFQSKVQSSTVYKAHKKFNELLKAIYGRKS